MIKLILILAVLVFFGPTLMQIASGAWNCILFALLLLVSSGIAGKYKASNM